MHFTSLLALALPMVAMAQNVTSSTFVAPTNITSTEGDSADVAPNGGLDYKTICESQAFGYSDYCPYCLTPCESETDEEHAALCYHTLFTEVNNLEAVCDQYGGENCRNAVVYEVCVAHHSDEPEEGELDQPEDIPL